MICMNLEKGWSQVRPFCPASLRSYLDSEKTNEAKDHLLQSCWRAVGLTDRRSGLGFLYGPERA
jgi:hypothetical protein